ncbi:MAG: peptide ABC transporter permease [Spirochaetes bacterium RBG_16_67_19]|nr:MAG: peptide ABC transporter permease [Spirochaetes bacterium RBG_16_67_19]
MLWVLLTLVFVVLRVMPGDPVSAMIGGHAPERVIEEQKEKLGLNRPILVQYFAYLGDLARLDLGNSMIYNQKVSQPLLEKLPATLELTIVGMGFTMLIGIPLGAYAASRRRTGRDFGIRLFGNVAYCIPVFWMGLMLQLVFGIWLNLLPIAGRTGPRVYASEFQKTGFYLLDTLIAGQWASFGDVAVHLLLPSLTLGIVLSGIFIRLTRANMLDTLKADYVLAARARGIPERRVVYGHALKNAFIPVLTMLGLQFAALLAGAILTETTFSWPGMGRLLVERIYLRDYPTIQGVIVMFAFFVSIVSLIVDLIYAVIDPRVRY